MKKRELKIKIDKTDANENCIGSGGKEKFFLNTCGI